jgi:hypothetical protein
MTKTSKAAYCAAMLDGEGHISINAHLVPNKQGGKYWLIDCKVGISNTSVPLMEWLVSNFGGKYYDGKQGHNKICYRWYLDGYENMEKFILSMLPYMIIKREQAKIALEFVRMRGQKNPVKRMELSKRCTALNKGISPTTNTLNSLPNCTVLACGPSFNPNLKEMKIESDLHGDMQESSVTLTQ